jgi:hypothetical protein
LDTLDLLWVWEVGSGRQPLERALVALAAQFPETTWDELVRASVGERNRGLLELRRAIMGPRLGCVVECPACGSRLALELDVDVLLAGAPARAREQSALELEVDGYRVSYRLLTSDDLRAVGASATQAEARLELIDRCVLRATRTNGSTRVPAGALPAAVVEALAEAVSEADPLVDVRLGVVCAECDGQWQPSLDISSLVWGEVSALARQGFDDVHTLATAYGWREADILAMSPLRRQAYLERIGNG